MSILQIVNARFDPPKRAVRRFELTCRNVSYDDEAVRLRARKPRQAHAAVELERITPKRTSPKATPHTLATFAPASASSLPDSTDLAEISTDGIDTHLLARRARFHTLQNLTVRTHELAAARRSGSRLQTAAVLACSAYDLVLGAALKKTRRPLLVSRSVANAADTALWSLSMPDDYELATLPAVGTGIEAGLRHGLAGAAVLVPGTVATAFARKVRGLPVHLRSFAGPALAILAGAGFATFRSRWVATIERSAKEQVAAKHHQGRITGMSQVAIGADTILDALTTSLVPMGQAGLSPLWKRISAWKQDLAEQLTSADAAYLEVTLRAWASERNRRNHRLASDVHIGVLQPKGSGALLLTGSQPADLIAALDRLDISGDVPVTVMNPDEARHAGTRLRIRAGSHVIEIPADTSSVIHPLNPDIGILVAGIAWSLGAGTKIGSPLWATLPGAGAYLASAAGTHNLTAKRRDTAFKAIMASLASAGITTLFTSTAAKHSQLKAAPREGCPATGFVPLSCSLDAPALLIGIHWDELTSAERAAAITGALSVTALGILLAPRPLRPLSTALNLLWPLTTAITGIDLSSAFKEEALARSATLHSRLQSISSRSEAEGRDRVRRFLHDALREARAQYQSHQQPLQAAADQVGAPLAQDIQVEVQARLDSVARRLEELDCTELSSS